MAAAGKSMPAPFLFYFKEQLKSTWLGRAHRRTGLLSHEFTGAFTPDHPFVYRQDVNEQLIDDITRTRLKIFLKCEDRCAMWHGVESRTPFSDDKDLISLMFSFDGNRKIKDGKLKYFLREAMKDHLPPEINNRFDKRGFETPMARWIEALKPRMQEEVEAAGFDFIDRERLKRHGALSPNDSKLLFKLFVLARWKKVFATA